MEEAARKFQEAKNFLQNGDTVQAEAILRELWQENARDYNAAWMLAVLLYSAQKPEEARKVLARLLQLVREEQGEDSPVVLRIMTLLARCHIAVNDFANGLPMARDVVAKLSRTNNEEQLAAACFFLSSAEYQTGNLDEAEKLTNRAIRLFEKLGGHEADISTCLNNLGRIYEERGDLEQGIAYHRHSVQLHKKAFGTHPQTAFALGNLGVALASAGQFAEAAQILEECLQVYAETGIHGGREVDGYRRNLEICRKALSD